MGGSKRVRRKDERIAAEPALATQFDGVIYSSVGSILLCSLFVLSEAEGAWEEEQTGDGKGFLEGSPQLL